MSNICMIPLMIGLRSIGMASDMVADKDEHNQPQNIPKRPRAHLLQLRIREMPRSINRDQRSPLSLILPPLSWIPPICRSGPRLRTAVRLCISDFCCCCLSKAKSAFRYWKQFELC